MPLIPEIVGYKDELTNIRRDIHKHPELCFDEHRTSALVAEQLESYGVDVTRGVAKTGVVGSLRVGNGHRAIGLRADMDALPLHEKNDFAHRSQHDGRMHACGHDGHTTILLGAARYLAKTRNFDGTVHFIFQPAEEGGGGGRIMVEEGLFERFPVDAVYGLHNTPRYPVGKFFTRPGPVMASSASFDLHVSGRGGHAARPESGLDPVVAAAHIITGLQTIVSRNVSPFDTAVLSITQVHAGDAYNIIPEDVRICGNCRSYKTKVMDRIEDSIRRIAENTAAAHGSKTRLDFRRGYPPLVNHEREAGIACDAAELVVGSENVDRNGAPRMASEDFSYMLEARPGAFIFLGNGDAEGSCDVHNPHYDFNDEILPVGASFFARLIEMTMPKER